MKSARTHALRPISRRSRTAPAALAAGAALGGALACAPLDRSALGQQSYWLGPGNYQYFVPGLTDFDQMRDGLNQFLGLQDYPGMMYCGPATGLNILAYLNANGYPDVLPNDAADIDWSAAANHGVATERMQQLAEQMPCVCVENALKGTWPDPFVNGLRSRIKAAGADLTVTAALSSANFSPTTDQLAVAGLNGSLIALIWQEYQVVGFTPNNYRIVVPTYHAHFVTASRIKRAGPFAAIWVRDPADEPINPPNVVPNLNAESGFRNRFYWTDDGWVFVLQAPGVGYWRWTSRLNDSFFPPYPNIGGKFIFIDGVFLIRRAEARAIKPDGKLALIRRGGEGNDEAGLLCEEFDPGFDVLAFDDIADLNAVVVIAENAAADGVATPNNIRIIEASTGQIAEIAEIPGAHAVAMGRNRLAYVLAGGTALHGLPLPSLSDEAYPDADGVAAPIATTLPHPGTALAFDDENDELVVLSAGDRVIMRVAADLAGMPPIAALPNEVEVDESAALVVHPGDGSLWVVSGASGSLFRLVASKGADGDLVATVIDLPGVDAPTSVTFRPNGNLVVGVGDGLKEFEQSGAEWQMVADSEFASIGCALRSFRVERSRSNFDPTLHDPKDWTILDPIVIGPGITFPDPGCAGDLNGDGVVDAADLGILVAAWGPNFGSNADINDDDVVDGADLGVLLANWGPCFR
ncbi:MAG TPA: hypothetical protein PKC43_09660 [Phycisphaerales bacterium]|nr:hypothetical protein [Phycisphaerales bacterium]HMP37700.1 hypothetical protein [Phycisphaerales bacterium]